MASLKELASASAGKITGALSKFADMEMLATEAAGFIVAQVTGIASQNSGISAKDLLVEVAKGYTDISQAEKDIVKAALPMLK